MIYNGLSSIVCISSSYFDHIHKAARADAAAALAAQGGITEKEHRWIALAQQQIDAIYAPADRVAEAHRIVQSAIFGFDADTS